MPTTQPIIQPADMRLSNMRLRNIQYAYLLQQLADDDREMNPATAFTDITLKHLVTKITVRSDDTHVTDISG